MENKYYTPKIEEFRVGFEFEYCVQGEWIKDKVLEKHCKNLHAYRLDNIRVKSLDRVDIESFGFEYHSGLLFLAGEHLYEYELWFEGKGRVMIYDRGSLGLKFIGVIKNKSELEVVFKQIGYEIS